MTEGTMPAKRRRRAPLTKTEIRIDPSGRPLEKAGYEAVFALGILCTWMIVMGGVLALMGEDKAATGPWPMYALMALTCFCWWYAEILMVRRNLIWPASALGIVGPLSLGFAVSLATPELRVWPFLPRLAIIATVAGIGMIPFLFRFRLPGLVSPVITFSLVGLFLGLYGADMSRLREVEGFSPRGIVAALMREPEFMALFGVLGLGALVYARRLDWKGQNFELAVARPLHLIGGGITALVAGRLLAMLPSPADLVTLMALWVATQLWALRVNRIAVLFATHFAMAKPLILAWAALFGLTLDIWDWTMVLGGILVWDFVTWWRLHKWSRAIDWTRGPGGRRPPLDRPNERWGRFWWRYWPYALEDPKSGDEAKEQSR